MSLIVDESDDVCGEALSKSITPTDQSRLCKINEIVMFPNDPFKGKDISDSSYLPISFKMIKPMTTDNQVEKCQVRYIKGYKPEAHMLLASEYPEYVSDLPSMNMKGSEDVLVKSFQETVGSWYKIHQETHIDILQLYNQLLEKKITFDNFFQGIVRVIKELFYKADYLYVLEQLYTLLFTLLVFRRYQEFTALYMFFFEDAVSIEEAHKLFTLNSMLNERGFFSVKLFFELYTSGKEAFIYFMYRHMYLYNSWRAYYLKQNKHPGELFQLVHNTNYQGFFQYTKLKFFLLCQYGECSKVCFKCFIVSGCQKVTLKLLRTDYALMDGDYYFEKIRTKAFKRLLEIEEKTELKRGKVEIDQPVIIIVQEMRCNEGISLVSPDTKNFFEEIYEIIPISKNLDSESAPLMQVTVETKNLPKNFSKGIFKHNTSNCMMHVPDMMFTSVVPKRFSSNIYPDDCKSFKESFEKFIASVSPEMATFFSLTVATPDRLKAFMSFELAKDSVQHPNRRLLNIGMVEQCNKANAYSIVADIVLHYMWAHSDDAGGNCIPLISMSVILASKFNSKSYTKVSEAVFLKAMIYFCLFDEDHINMYKKIPMFLLDIKSDNDEFIKLVQRSLLKLMTTIRGYTNGGNKKVMANPITDYNRPPNYCSLYFTTKKMSVFFMYSTPLQFYLLASKLREDLCDKIFYIDFILTCTTLIDMFDNFVGILWLSKWDLIYVEEGLKIMQAVQEKRNLLFKLNSKDSQCFNHVICAFIKNLKSFYMYTDITFDMSWI